MVSQVNREVDFRRSSEGGKVVVAEAVYQPIGEEPVMVEVDAQASAGSEKLKGRNVGKRSMI